MLKRILGLLFLSLILIYIAVWLSTGLLIKRYYISFIDSINEKTGHYLSIPSDNYQLYLSGFPFGFTLTLEDVKLESNRVSFSKGKKSDKSVKIEGQLVSKWNLFASNVSITYKAPDDHNILVDNTLFPNMSDHHPIVNDDGNIDYANIEFGFKAPLIWSLITNNKGGLEEILNEGSIKYINLNVKPFIFSHKGGDSSTLKSPLNMHLRFDKKDDREIVHFDTQPFAICESLSSHLKLPDSIKLPSVFSKCQPFMLDFDFDFETPPLVEMAKSMGKLDDQGSNNPLTSPYFNSPIGFKGALHLSSSKSFMQMLVHLPYPFIFKDFITGSSVNYPEWLFSISMKDGWYKKMGMNKEDHKIFSGLEDFVLGAQKPSLNSIKSKAFNLCLMPGLCFFGPSNNPLNLDKSTAMRLERIVLFHKLRSILAKVGKRLDEGKIMSVFTLKIEIDQKGNAEIEFNSSYNSEPKGELKINYKNILNSTFDKAKLSPIITLNKPGYFSDLYLNVLSGYCNVKEHSACSSLKPKILRWTKKNMTISASQMLELDFNNMPKDAAPLWGMIQACTEACFANH
jgi:hypothetical protein